MWSHHHLLSISDLSPVDLTALLDAADRALSVSRRPIKKLDTLRGKTIINLFLEPSTRTRSSFELAGKRLGADVVNVSPSTSSVTKGETLLDTVRNLQAMHADVIVLRHPAAGAPAFVARRMAVASPPAPPASIVNAGDGAHEHPTQALLDALTIRNAKGRIAGLVVTLCGDILHSRVARSNALLLGKLGAEVRLCGPRTMMPVAPTALGNTVRVFERIDDAVRGADVVMMLRIQNERLGSAMMATTREYSRTFGLNPRVFALAKPDAVLLHPGPINRGVELDTLLADGTQSRILDQVEAGVAVRMTVLELVVKARESASASAAESSVSPPSRPAKRVKRRSSQAAQ